MSAAWIFPGQGSQRARMASGFGGSAELFETAHEVLGDDLRPISTQDPKPTWAPERLQSALFITCVAGSLSLAAKGLAPAAVAGHSLGEYAALAAAGAMDFADALSLVALRARAMAKAAQKNPGGMAAVVGLPAASVQEICAEVTQVWAANFNTPSQTVISGKDAALSRAAELCIKAGASKVVRLEVPMAGHCPLMAPAAREVEKALNTIAIRRPQCPFYSGADALAHTEPGEISRLLVRAMVSPVRFVETVKLIAADGSSAILEIGPGSVLRGLVRQIAPEVQLFAVGSDEEAESVSHELGALAAP